MRADPARLFHLRDEFDDRQGNIKTQLSFSGRFWQSWNIKQRQETSFPHLFGQIVVGLLEPFERERFEPLLVEKHCLHSVRLGFVVNNRPPATLLISAGPIICSVSKAIKKAF